MTHDPPETRATWKDVLAEAERQAKAEDASFDAQADWERFRARALAETGIDPDKVVLGQPPPRERDPSNLNDPALQRWVVAFAWLLTLVLLGTCVAGGACLLGAFRGDAESEDG